MRSCLYRARAQIHYQSLRPLIEYQHLGEMHAAIVGVNFPDLFVAVVEKIESVANGQLWQRVYFAGYELLCHVRKVVGYNALYLRSIKLFTPIPFSISISATILSLSHHEYRRQNIL